MTQIGKILIISGSFFLAIGCIMFLFGDKVKWFGNISLDFSYKSDSANIYVPIGSMILLSLILSIIANILFKLFKWWLIASYYLVKVCF